VRIRILFSVACLTMLSATLLPTSVRAQSGYQVARAQYEQLVLTLRVHTSGSTVYARAILRNTGSDPFTYYGACAPPVLQIQARDGDGQRVYGYVKPRITCHALSVLQLDPGTSISQSAHFSGHGDISIYGKVPAGTSQRKLFTTRALSLRLPANTAK